MTLQEYYNRINKMLEEIPAEMDCIEHYFFADGKKDYELYAEICKKLGFEGIIDIGCAYGHQSEIFLEQGLNYHGIDNGCHHFWNEGKPGITYQTVTYPCEISVDTKKLLPVSRMCLGFELTDYDAIARDFDCILVNSKQGQEKLKEHFDLVAEFCGAPEGYLYVKKGADAKALDKILQDLKKPAAQTSFPVSGVQFPGEDGIVKEAVDEMFARFSGYYFDFIFVEGDFSSAYFMVDSDLYAEWEEKGLLDDFRSFIRAILNDINQESSDNVYHFHGEPIYFGYI